MHPRKKNSVICLHSHFKLKFYCKQNVDSFCPMYRGKFMPLSLRLVHNLEKPQLTVTLKNECLGRLEKKKWQTKSVFRQYLSTGSLLTKLSIAELQKTEFPIPFLGLCTINLALSQKLMAYKNNYNDKIYRKFSLLQLYYRQFCHQTYMSKEIGEKNDGGPTIQFSIS